MKFNCFVNILKHVSLTVQAAARRCELLITSNGDKFRKISPVRNSIAIRRSNCESFHLMSQPCHVGYSKGISRRALFCFWRWASSGRKTSLCPLRGRSWRKGRAIIPRLGRSPLCAPWKNDPKGSRRASYDPAHRKFLPSPLSPLPILGYPRFIGHVSNDSPYFQAARRYSLLTLGPFSLDFPSRDSQGRIYARVIGITGWPCFLYASGS